MSISVKNVTKSFGSFLALDNVSLEVPGGELLALLGPSGSGKTTTLRMIAGHEEASEGDVILGSENITHLPPAARGTAMMFQSYALFPHLDCTDNVAFSLKMRGVDKDTRRARALDMLRRKVGPQLDHHIALGGFDDEGVLGIGFGGHRCSPVLPWGVLASCV